MKYEQDESYFILSYRNIISQNQANNDDLFSCIYARIDLDLYTTTWHAVKQCD